MIVFFGAGKLTEYNSHGFGFDARNFVDFGISSSSSLHAGNRKKDILVLDEGPADGQDNTTVTA